MSEEVSAPAPDSNPASVPEPGLTSSPEPAPTWKARQVDAARRLAEIFGDVLPESTSDDRDPTAADRRDDSWYTENRPPHHDAR